MKSHYIFKTKSYSRPAFMTFYKFILIPIYKKITIYKEMTIFHTRVSS